MDAGRGTRRLLSLAVALSLSPIVAAPSAIARTPSCFVPGEQRTIEVQVKVLDKVVQRGKTVRIEVRTYRPAQKDFLGSGQDTPPGAPREPVGNVDLTVGVLTGDERVAQNAAARTDSKGKRLVKIKLVTYHRRGPAEVRARAKIDHFSEQPTGTCVELQEGGYTEHENAFTVR